LFIQVASYLSDTRSVEKSPSRARSTLGDVVNFSLKPLPRADGAMAIQASLIVCDNCISQKTDDSNCRETGQIANSVLKTLLFPDAIPNRHS
jgi:hypothetical protein